MSTELEPGQKLRRLVKVYGIEGMVVATFTHEGIEFKIPKTKLGVMLTWPDAVQASGTPSNVPSKHEGRPMEFLLDQSYKQAKRSVERELKKENK
jgi:hypothetical protein